jgi:cytochrome bd-type quinol oxidase subunit 2
MTAPATPAPGPAGTRRVAARVVGLVPVALVVIAEAAWISVLGGLIQEFTLHEPQLGIAELAVVVGLGAIAAHTLGPRLGKRWPFVALALVVAAAIVGLFASGAARAALAIGIGPALAAHPAGVLAGLAMLRGFAHARLPLAEGTLTRLLALGAPGLAFAALIGGLIVEPYRSRFLTDTLAASIVFIGATVLALAFARLGAIGEDRGLDWRRNPSWLGLTVLLMIAAIAAALPMAAVAGTAIPILISLSLGPMLVAGLAAGLDRTGRRILAFFAIVVGLIFLWSFFGSSPVTVPVLVPPAGSTAPPNPDADRMMTIGIGGLVVVAVVAAVLVLVFLWMRRQQMTEDDDLEETRVVDHGDGEPASQTRRRLRFGRRSEPSSAVEAYVSLLAELARHPLLRRAAAETPAEHAARLREAGASGLALDLLAADYALARDAGRTLSAPEDRRAVHRWRTLRSSLPRWAREQARIVGALAEDPAVPHAAELTEGSRTGVRMS